MGNLNDVPFPLDDLPFPLYPYPNPSNKYGRLYMSVRSKIDDFLPKFESLRLNERFSFLYNYSLSNDLLFKLEIKSTKSAVKALEYKNRGNEAFLQKKLMKALQLYTKCVAFAPSNSKELAVAFANRSAVLLRLKRYEACLVDINRALRENHYDLPKSWNQKLLNRKRECVVNWEKYCADKMNHLVFLSSSTIDDDTLEDWIRHRKNECEFDENATDMNYDDKFFLPSGNLRNPLIPNASAKFKVNYSPEMGRHMIATENIKAGELLHIEKPYATIFTFDFRYKHCTSCLVRCEALIPCPTCSQVMYCSVRCRDDAYNRYHRVECAILPIALKFEESEIAWLALRILLIATKQGEELETILKHPAYQEPMKKTDLSVLENFDSDFMHVYNLMFDHDCPNGKYHPSCINAVLTLYILKHSNFFAASTGKKINHEALTDVEAHVGNILMRLMLIASTNSKHIEERYEKEILVPDGPVCIMRRVAFGIYPFASFYNHSCDENVANAFHKDTIVCHASQPIDAGQQLCMDYAMFHHETPTEKRQQCLLKESNFICKCEACSNNWPTSKDFTDLVQNFLMIGDVASVNQGELFALAFAFTEWQRAKFQKNVHSAKHLKLVCDYTSVFGKIVEKKCNDYFECQREIRLIFWERANYYHLDQDEVLIRLLI